MNPSLAVTRVFGEIDATGGAGDDLRFGTFWTIDHCLLHSKYLLLS